MFQLPMQSAVIGQFTNYIVYQNMLVTFVRKSMIPSVRFTDLSEAAADINGRAALLHVLRLTCPRLFCLQYTVQNTPAADTDKTVAS